MARLIMKKIQEHFKEYDQQNMLSNLMVNLILPCQFCCSGF
jgi:hypothetical protein